jgi:glutaredoxin
LKSFWFPVLPMAAPFLRDVRLYRMALPDHACPWGLRVIRLLQEQHIPFEDHPLRSEAEIAAFKAAHAVATTPQLFAGDERIGGYTDLAALLGVRPEAATVSYTPVIAVFATAALMSGVLAEGIGGFMGIALCLLAMLKLMDVEAFAASFRRYDLLSQRWTAWARFYPGIELLVGLGVLIRPEVFAAARLIGAMVLLLGAMGMMSVGKAVFVDKLALNCACVGGNARVPLGMVSFAENLLIALMGGVMVTGG